MVRNKANAFLAGLSAAAVALLGAVARSDEIYFDDFQQFPNGTVLTQTNYVPNIGLEARIKTNEDGVASVTAVASNFLGSTRAFFRQDVSPRTTMATAATRPGAS